MDHFESTNRTLEPLLALVEGTLVHESSGQWLVHDTEGDTLARHEHAVEAVAAAIARKLADAEADLVHYEKRFQNACRSAWTEICLPALLANPEFPKSAIAAADDYIKALKERDEKGW